MNSDVPSKAEFRDFKKKTENVLEESEERMDKYVKSFSEFEQLMTETAEKNGEKIEINH